MEPISMIALGLMALAKALNARNKTNESEDTFSSTASNNFTSLSSSVAQSKIEKSTSSSKSSSINAATSQQKTNKKPGNCICQPEIKTNKSNITTSNKK